ncbi:MAG: hypothetical protein K8F25_01300 [Fimbriimonadaceae bacterium]|nr:hypothetical protein [Alphaproteobacteria bacterium]
MRDEMPIWLLVAIPILGIALTYFLVHWWAEYCFYKTKKWDYSIDNPDGQKMYHGEIAIESQLMSNRTRVVYGYPFFVFVIGLIFVSSIYFVYRIQSCDADDLKKCGITIKNGEVTLGG